MAVDMLPLGQPGASTLEIMFRRMLLQCQLRTQQQAGQDWRSDPKFHCIVEALQEKLYDLEQSAADRPSPDVLQQYKTAVAAITDELRQPDLPAYCLRVTAQDRLPDASSDAAGRVAAASGISAAKGAAAALLSATRSPAQQYTSSTSQADDSTKPTAADAGGSSNSSASFSLSSSAQEKLRTQQRLQDELTEELLGMGQELKASTLAMQSAIRYRGKLLDDAEVALVDSTANAQSVAAKAKQQYKQGNWNFCRALLMLLVAVLIFGLMIVFIRFTTFIGLTGS